MEQRRLRLGDITDDYCPRERRVTNHAVVAMIEEDVKQTRCTTCDAEHAYKGGRPPKRRKKETVGTLYEEVLAGLPEGGDEAKVQDSSSPEPVLPIRPPAIPQPESHAMPERAHGNPARTAPRAEPDAALGRLASGSAAPFEDRPEPEAPASIDEPANSEPGVDGPVHRRLIRATLPRIEGQKDARPIPEFTVRQAPTRGPGHGGRPNPNFRGERVRMGGGNGNGNANGHGEPNGNRAQSSSASRFQGGRPGGGRPPGGRSGGPSGFRNGNGNGAGPRGKRGRGSRG